MCVKRDLVCVKRDLVCVSVCQKRPSVCQKRPSVCQKRPSEGKRESVREDSQSATYTSDVEESDGGEGTVGGCGRGGGEDNAGDERLPGLFHAQGLLRICTLLYFIKSPYRGLLRISSFQSPCHVAFGEHKF